MGEVRWGVKRAGSNPLPTFHKGREIKTEIGERFTSDCTSGEVTAEHAGNAEKG